MSGGRARRTRFAWGLGVALASLTLFFVLVVVGLEPDVSDTLSADAYSVSGLGHSGLLALLDENEVPVRTSRWDSAAHARPGTSLVIAEPNPDLERASGRRPLEAMVKEARRVLLVAPKRLPGPPAPERPRWMRSQFPMEVPDVNRVFEEWGLEVHRPTGQVENPLWESAKRWPTPTLVDPVQLFRHYEALIPLVSTDEGVLLGRLEMPQRDHLVLVLSDPDVLANHGLVRGENAAFCLALIEELRDGTGGVVWDETWHGHVVPTHIGRLLLRPPLGYVTASLALVALLALWAGAVRFGGAVPPAPALAPGKAFLVENTADLLRAGGHSGHVLRRYLEAAERETADRLHAGRGRPGAAREAVEALAKARGLAAPGELHEDVERAARAGATDARAIVAAGERIHRWKEELTHGRRRGS